MSVSKKLTLTTGPVVQDHICFCTSKVILVILQQLLRSRPPWKSVCKSHTVNIINKQKLDINICKKNSFFHWDPFSFVNSVQVEARQADMRRCSCWVSENTSSVLALTSSQAFHSAPHFFFQNNDAFQLKDKGVLDMCQVEFIMAAIGGERNFTTFPSFDADTSSSWFGYLVNNTSLSLCVSVNSTCAHTRAPTHLPVTQQYDFAPESIGSQPLWNHFKRYNLLAYCAVCFLYVWLNVHFTQQCCLWNIVHQVILAISYLKIRNSVSASRFLAFLENKVLMLRNKLSMN